MGNKKNDIAVKNDNAVRTYADTVALSVTRRTFETETGNRAFTYTERTKDGQLVEKTVFEPAIVEIFERVDYLTQVSDESRKALCIELSLITEEAIKKAGIKGGFAGFITKCFGAKLDSNTAGRYRRIGKVFGTKSITETDGTVRTSYVWKSPISADVSVTNLGQVLGLVGLPKDYDKLSDDEICELYDKFVSTYIVSGALSLDCSLKELRKAIRELSDMVTATAEEVENGETENGENGEPENGEPENGETNEESATLALDTLALYFKGNEKALALLTELSEMLK